MQDNQPELETTAAANDTSCSCPSARELAVTRFQQAMAFAAAKVNQIRKAATEQASTICDYAQEKGEVIRDKAKKFHEAGEEYVKENSYDSMIERELRVMKMLADIQETWEEFFTHEIWNRK